MTSLAHAPAPPATGIDPRGPRLAAAVTSAVLALALLLPTTASILLIAVQGALFAIGAIGGVRRTPHAWLYARLVRPRLGPASTWEDPEPPRFAQAVGLAFTVLALLAHAASAPTVAQVAVGLALVAALLNAVFDLCLGCELYLILRRLA